MALPALGSGCYAAAMEINAMSKLELAIKEAEKLPDELREKLGDDLLHYIHKYLALRDDLEAGLRDLDAGREYPADEVFARLRSRHGL
jgi:hypothetical protein